jgi:hypothetical protein
MDAEPTGPWDLERLLTDPACDGPGGLAAVLRAAVAPASEAELTGEAAVLAAFTDMGPGISRSPFRDKARRIPMLSTLLASKLAATAAAGGLAIAGTAAAAYTGSLPVGLQSVAHQTIGAPAATPSGDTTSTPESDPTDTAEPTDTADPTTTADPTSTATPVGPDATGPAAFGLCTAYTHGGLATSSVAYSALVKAAGDASKIGAYCATVSHPTGSSTSHPTAPVSHPTGSPTTHPTPPVSHPTGSPTTHPTPPVSHPTGSPTSRPRH